MSVPTSSRHRLRLVIVMTFNMLALWYVTTVCGQRGWLAAILVLHVFAAAAGGVIVRTAPGISQLGLLAYLCAVAAVIAISLYPLPAGRPAPPLTLAHMAYGPALLYLAAAVIAAGPGWGKPARRHP